MGRFYLNMDIFLLLTLNIHNKLIKNSNDNYAFYSHL